MLYQLIQSPVRKEISDLCRSFREHSILYDVKDPGYSRKGEI